jgi:adenylate cyclase
MEATPGPNEERWRRMLTGEDHTLARGHNLYRAIPSSPRCKLCGAPFAGPGGAIMRHFGWSRWEKNPRFCQWCHKSVAKLAVGGAEVEISVLFADIRGSTTMAETMRPTAFRALVERFYRAAEGAIVDEDGLVDNELGDGILALFIPVWAGSQHASRAMSAGRRILHATGHDGPSPWVPVGVGIHTGLAFVGVVSSSDEADDFTALGDTVNTASRLAGSAAAGELLVSLVAARAAGMDLAGLEHRSLELKGKTAPVEAVVAADATRKPATS